ncbi:MAG: FoF1 ATP synthase subunit delta/epsilon [Christensenellales bacterium]
MKLSIVTPKGISFDGEVDYIVIDGDNGQLAILQNHIPIVVSIRYGFIKRVNNDSGKLSYYFWWIIRIQQ